MNTQRRKFLRRSVAVSLMASGFGHFVHAKQSPASAALDKSALIYLSPILSNGKESACHGEVWFVHLDNEIFVVTQHDAWRAQAVRQGLKTAAIWIGEFGVWKRAKDKYRSAPYMKINIRLTIHTGILAFTESCTL